MTEDEGKTKPSQQHKLVGPRMVARGIRDVKQDPGCTAQTAKGQGRAQGWMSPVTKKEPIFFYKTHQCSTALTIIVSSSKW